MKVIASHQLQMLFPNSYLCPNKKNLLTFFVGILSETKPINFLCQIVTVIVHFPFDCVNIFTYFIATTSGNLLTLMKLHFEIGDFERKILVMNDLI